MYIYSYIWHISKCHTIFMSWYGMNTHATPWIARWKVPLPTRSVSTGMFPALQPPRCGSPAPERAASSDNPLVCRPLCIPEPNVFPPATLSNRMFLAAGSRLLQGTRNDLPLGSSPKPSMHLFTAFPPSNAVLKSGLTVFIPPI